MLCHNRYLSEVLIISLKLEEVGRVFTNSISGSHVLAPLQYTDLNGYVLGGVFENSTHIMGLYLHSLLSIKSTFQHQGCC